MTGCLRSGKVRNLGSQVRKNHNFWKSQEKSGKLVSKSGKVRNLPFSWPECRCNTDLFCFYVKNSKKISSRLRRKNSWLLVFCRFERFNFYLWRKKICITKNSALYEISVSKPMFIEGFHAPETWFDVWK